LVTQEAKWENYQMDDLEQRRDEQYQLERKSNNIPSIWIVQRRVMNSTVTLKRFTAKRNKANLYSEQDNLRRC
jgi:hypothetical protein